MLRPSHSVLACAAASFACLTLTACRPTERQRRADVQAVAQVIRDIESADTAGDLDRVVALYGPGATLAQPAGDEIRGENAIRDHYRRLFEQSDLNVAIYIDELNARRPWAYCSGTTAVAATPRTGGEPQLRRDRFLMVLRRVNGVWRVHRLSWWPLAGE
jgi:uncharacterized protein (TIGR02246 family)